MIELSYFLAGSCDRADQSVWSGDSVVQFLKGSKPFPVLISYAPSFYNRCHVSIFCPAKQIPKKYVGVLSC